MAGDISASLNETHGALAAILEWPDNLGIQFRTLTLADKPAARVLVVFVTGLADEQLVEERVIRPLLQNVSSVTEAARLPNLLSAPRIRLVEEMAEAVQGILAGATAVFRDGWHTGVLIETAHPAERPAGVQVVVSPHEEIFGPGVLDNLALLRKRLHDPALVARPITLPQGRAVTAALVYMKGRPAPEVLSHVREWMLDQAGEDALRHGRAAGNASRFGLLPTLLSTQWPNKVATLLSAGYVAVMVDQVAYAFVAPVTATALLHGPGDNLVRRPGMGALVRVLLAAVVIMAPAGLVALMTYHQDMIPTSFLVVLSVARDNAPFPITAEVILLAVFQEIVREATYRLPFTIQPGQALIISAVFMVIVVQAGLLGAVSAVVTILVAVATLGLPGSDIVYVCRVWGFWFIAAAAVLGLYGMAVALFLLMGYFSRTRSFGVPFLGETGIQFRTAGFTSSRQGRRPDHDS